jgi:tetratricopeptide (TPR) repeat protein
MALDEIEKLKARVEKDPDSKLFLPLAEEYRKEGMFDEAIDVLKKGLERHPSYVTARVALGKTYLEQGKEDEALGEFEEVIAAVPDNLFAQKKIAEIYRDRGDMEKALQHFQKVAYLNPNDDDAAKFLDEHLPASAEPETEAEKEVQPETSHQELNSISFGLEEEPEISDVEEVSSQKESETPEDLPVGPGMDQVDSEDPGKVEDQGFEEYREFSEFIGEKVHEDTELQAEEINLAGQDEENDVFTLSEEEEVLQSFAEFSNLTMPDETDETASADEKRKMLLRKADDYVRSEEYLKAMDIYNEFLRENPEDREARQRLQELRQLLKMIGKDPDILAERLESLLSGLRERRDEFFGDA